MNMSIDSVISNTINNIIIGDMFLSVRNAEGQEQIQIYPARFENIYTHKWTKENREVGDNEEYKDEGISSETKVYCKFKINGKLTHVMYMEVLEMLCSEINPATSTIYFMPYNIHVLQDMEAEYKFSCGLVDFIERAFPELPTTCVHDYEQMKLTEDTLIGHKRRRDEILNM
jgi:hypothetical protein